MLEKIGEISNRDLREIRQAVSKGLTVEKLEQLVQKYGYDVVVSAFVSSTSAASVQ